MAQLEVEVKVCQWCILNEPSDYKAVCLIMKSNYIIAPKSETKDIYHSLISICFHTFPHVLGAGGPVHQRNFVPASLKAPMELVVLC